MTRKIVIGRQKFSKNRYPGGDIPFRLDRIGARDVPKSNAAFVYQTLMGDQVWLSGLENMPFLVYKFMASSVLKSFFQVYAANPDIQENRKDIQPLTKSIGAASS